MQAAALGKAENNKPRPLARWNHAKIGPAEGVITSPSTGCCVYRYPPGLWLSAIRTLPKVRTRPNARDEVLVFF
jgi:hypothetical protein